MKMFNSRLISLAVVLLNVKITSGLVTSIPFPEKLKTCYEEKSQNIHATQIPAHEIQVACIRDYLYEEANNLIHSPKLGESAENYVKSIMRRIGGEIRSMVKERRKPRHKRQTRIWRIRKEIRTLTREEWHSFTDSLNRLKTDFSMQSDLSKYDILAAMHAGTTMSFVHGGANFVGWHQIYLLVLESEMGVPIPYWDSSLDHEMDFPNTTILFTDKYFGNGDGYVSTGPFKDWRTIANTSILRNIASGESSLLTREAIDLVLNATRMDQIVEPQIGRNSWHSLERHHNGPHVWVDGHMSGVNTAPWDPIFFCHHAMIDSIWSAWRDKMDASGIEIRYPQTNQEGHRYNDTMSFEPFYTEIRNIDALHPYYRYLVRYERYPRYPNCIGEDITVNEAKKVCMSVGDPAGEPNGELSSMAGFRIPSVRTSSFGHASLSISSTSVGQRKSSKKRKPKFPSKPVAIGQKFGSSVFTDKRNKAKPLETTELDINTVKKLQNRIKASKILKSNKPSRSRNRSKSRKSSSFRKISRAAKSSFKVRKFRPSLARIRRSVNNAKELTTYRSYIDKVGESYQNSFMINGQVEKNLWTFVNVKVVYKRPSLNMNAEHLATYSHCVTGKQTDKVYIESVGLNYVGKYKDYISVSETRNVSKFVVKVGIKIPGNRQSQFILTAHDHCGRTCTPTCLDVYVGQYVPCGGAFKVTNELPKMYSFSRKDTTRNIAPDAIDTPVQFICDYRKAWPWESARK